MSGGHYCVHGLVTKTVNKTLPRAAKRVGGWGGESRDNGSHGWRSGVVGSRRSGVGSRGSGVQG